MAHRDNARLECRTNAVASRCGQPIAGRPANCPDRQHEPARSVNSGHPRSAALALADPSRRHAGSRCGESHLRGHRQKILRRSALHGRTLPQRGVGTGRRVLEASLVAGTAARDELSGPSLVRARRSPSARGLRTERRRSCEHLRVGPALHGKCHQGAAYRTGSLRTGHTSGGPQVGVARAGQDRSAAPAGRPRSGRASAEHLPARAASPKVRNDLRHRPHDRRRWSGSALLRKPQADFELQAPRTCVRREHRRSEQRMEAVAARQRRRGA